MIRRKGIDVLKVFTGVAVLSILLFSPATGNVGKTIVFQPFWFLEQMMATPDRFYWPKMASAMANYKLAGNWLKLILAYGLAFLVFWYGNLGTRIVKEPYVLEGFNLDRSFFRDGYYYWSDDPNVFHSVRNPMEYHSIYVLLANIFWNIGRDIAWRFIK